MKNNECFNFNEEQRNRKLKKHITIGIVFVILLLLFKIVIIPRLKEIENSDRIKIEVESRQGFQMLNLNIKIKSNLKEVLGKSGLEIYLDNKLIENNMIYIDNKDYSVYTKIKYENESNLGIVLSSENDKKIYFSKKLKMED